MTKLKIYDFNKQEKGDLELSDQITQSELNPFLIKDVVVYTLAKQRQGTHKVKDRSEISGSRKKLYRQKGTGNARAGTIQSPIRRGGGTVFGPVPRDHSISINKGVKKQVLTSVIAEAIRSNHLIVLEELKLDSYKTKNLVQILEKLNFKTALFVYSDLDQNLALASRNLPGIKILHANSLNVYDILKYKNIIISKEAIQNIEGRLLKCKKTLI